MRNTLKLLRNGLLKAKYLLIAFICTLWPIQALSNDEACLAVAMHKEASGEGLLGQRSILDVIQQRMKDKHKTACQVIKEPGQFSWDTTDVKATKQQLTRYRFIAKIPPVVHEARYFHSVKARPSWAKKMRVKAKIGKHLFY